MNSGVELHDSCVVGVTLNDGTAVVRLGPAYVHRSEGRPGWDPGSGWLQDVDLFIAAARVETAFSGLPQELDGGSLRAGDEVFENVIPLPLDLEGPVRLSLVSLEGERLGISGSGARAVPAGEARYVEQFPGGG